MTSTQSITAYTVRGIRADFSSFDEALTAALADHDTNLTRGGYQLPIIYARVDGQLVTIAECIASRKNGANGRLAEWTELPSRALRSQAYGQPVTQEGANPAPSARDYSTDTRTLEDLLREARAAMPIERPRPVCMELDAASWEMDEREVACDLESGFNQEGANPALSVDRTAAHRITVNLDFWTEREYQTPGLTGPAWRETHVFNGSFTDALAFIAPTGATTQTYEGLDPLPEIFTRGELTIGRETYHVTAIIQGRDTWDHAPVSRRFNVPTGAPEVTAVDCPATVAPEPYGRHIRIERSPLGTCFNVYVNKIKLANVTQYPKFKNMWWYDLSKCPKEGFSTKDAAIAHLLMDHCA